MNPTHGVSGPEFLFFAGGGLVACMGVGALMNRLLRNGHAHGLHQDDDLPRRPDPYLVATLAGRSAVIETALARLLHQGAIRLDPGRLETDANLPPDAPRIERAVYKAVSQGVYETAKLAREAAPAIEALKEPLVERGWLLGADRAFFSRWLPALPLMILMLAMFARLLQGFARDKPIGYLAVLLLVSVGLLLFRVRPTWRTLRGDTVLARFRDQQEPVKMASLTASGTGALDINDLGVSVGLYGLGAVALADFQALDRQLNVHAGSTGSSSDGGGGSCGGGSCGGGCGGGCGGCS
ncbi:TIGR04222 domain-containing membrane protein [Myxococcus stipitatus]|uniref:TIGR04222 domain-containing membrane protein n=1 Tax=Myxococcus stipitatus TaxID=83455 RepID=UPI001F452D24|nr:TIGR04222 domain-containing membrane protein [Myxococcus stipitatus]MCE9671415.1 TIGR04222 domain-containing membrane protein [Myxococcus stipitatus]